MKRLLAGILVLFTGLALVGFSFLRTIPVYDINPAFNEGALYEEISEIELTEYATFSEMPSSASTDRRMMRFDRRQPRGLPARPE